MGTVYVHKVKSVDLAIKFSIKTLCINPYLLLYMYNNVALKYLN